MLKVATYNVNSIRIRIGLVLEWLHREAPDILCLQETKVQDADFPAGAFQEAGYHAAFRGHKAAGGVAIISRERPQSLAFGFDDGGQPDEPRLARATIGGLALVNTYVPQGRSFDSAHFRYKIEWLGRLRVLFQQHYSPREPLLWMGDFNVAPETIDVHNPKGVKKHVDFHPQARAALEEIREWGFTDIFRLHHPGKAGQYTFWDYRAPRAVERGIGWRVDHIWTTEPLASRSTSAWIDLAARRGPQPSDHTFLVAEFDL